MKKTQGDDLVIFFDFSLTWTSIVRHMAEGDFIDSSDTVTEKERGEISKKLI